ncbi:MAG: sensor histidine kinase [Burkholderiales bacterium]|jgi:signal transduction histidine kinase
MAEPASRTHPPRSLRSRLLVRLLPPLLLLFAVSGTLSYLGARYHANEVHDRWLVDTAEALAQQVTFARGQPSLDLPEAARKILQWDSADTTWFQVRGESSGHIAGHTAVPGPAPHAPLERLRQAVLYDGWISGAHVRIATVPLAGAGEEVEVRVAETLRKRQALAAELLLSVLLPQLALLVVAGVVIWLTLEQLLAPVGAVARALEAQTHHSLEPVDDRALPAEVVPLTHAMNDLLLRLRGALAAQRHFIADAAHQLRTPLTALKLHADEAARETDPRRLAPVLAELRRAADRAVRLSNQLLTLARAEPSARIAAPRRIELRALVAEASARWVPAALAAGVDLGLAGGPQEGGAPIEVDGDPGLLAEAVNNLVDNALKYAGRGARVTVGIDLDGDRARITVDDDGPGIAPADRGRVMERFHRGARGAGDTADVQAGSGLGLPIVAEIVRGHDGEVRIEDGPHGRGTRVAITLPARAGAAVDASSGARRAVTA